MCSTKKFDESIVKKLTFQNLQPLHAYAIMNIDATREDGKFKLISIQNPNKVFETIFQTIKNDKDSNTYYYYKILYGTDMQNPGKIDIDIKDFSKYFNLIEYDKFCSKDKRLKDKEH